VTDDARPSIAAALGRPCIADTSVLSPLVQTNSAYLLKGLLSEPLHLGPTVLDEDDLSLPGFPALTSEPASESLYPLYVHGANFERHRARGSLIAAFSQAVRTDWTPAVPTSEELRIATRLASRPIRDAVRDACPDARFSQPLDAGEAEALAIASTRNWTLLVDDQAAVTAARCLYPGVPVVRLCALLIEAIQSGLISCADASHLYEHDMRQRLGFRTPLRIKCDPPRCATR
jgi:predicted nucleic acid-binding protein